MLILISQMNIEKRRIFCLAGWILTLFTVQDECKDGGKTVQSMLWFPC